MYNLILADLYSLRKSLTLKVLFVASLLCASVMTYISNLVTQGKIGIEISGIGSFFTDVHMTALLGSVVAAVYIVNDFETKTIHDAISSGSSRSMLVISKTFVYFFIIALIVLPYSIVINMAIITDNMLSPVLPSAFLNIMANEPHLTYTAALFVKMMVITLTIMIVYASQLSFCVLIAFVLRKKVLVIMIGYAIMFISGQLIALRDKYSILDTILSYTPYGVSFSQFVIDAEAGVFIKAIVISVLFSVLMIAITYVSFRKSEIK
ncbi:ABC transporter permease [Bacillus sp. Bva_UNVM-123]|uniref:ABC transporter permease n=1 Tax=Bacillus sp. Bva_UNVM-123 TaxID=2829798 RepID=UPI00391EE8F5